MRFIRTPLAFAFLVAALCALFPPEANAKVLHVFLDLDNYLVNEVHGRLGDARADRVVKTPGGQWRITDGAGEFLQAGSRLRGWEVRFSFFSARDEERNLAVADAIVLPNQKTARQAMDGRIFSSPHLAEIEIEGRTKRRKDLLKVGKGLADFELENAILIDNDLLFAAEGQLDNLMQVPHTAYFYESFLSVFDPTAIPLDPDEVANNVRGFLAYRNVMAYSLGLLDEALELAEKEALTPARALARLQWNAVTKVTFFDPLKSLHHDVRFYRRGAKLMRAVSPEFRLMTLEKSWPIPCGDHLKLVDWATLNEL